MTDKHILIIGAGISGMTAAVYLAMKGEAKVTLLSNGSPMASPSTLDREGVNGGYDTLKGDGPERFLADMAQTGGFLADAQLQRQLAHAVLDIRYFLERIGTLFDRAGDGSALAFGEGFKRTLACGSSSGFFIGKALLAQVRRCMASNSLSYMEPWEALSVIRDARGQCVGMTALNRVSHEVRALKADAVLSCAGGYGSLLSETRSSLTATGFLTARFFREGVMLANPEMIRFEARALPQTLGGLLIDERHATAVKGLYAAGEAAAGYHGAGCLPGNPLLSDLYGGMKGAEAALAYALHAPPAGHAALEAIDAIPRREHDAINGVLDLTGPENVWTLWGDLRNLMVRSLVNSRDRDGLAFAAEGIESLKRRFPKVTLADRSTKANPELWLALNFEPLLDLALAVVTAALSRQESRGVHMRRDFPKPNDALFFKTTRVSYDLDGPKVSFEDLVP